MPQLDIVFGKSLFCIFIIILKIVMGILCDCKIFNKLKEKFYRTVIRPVMLYGSGVAEMRMLRWMSNYTILDKIPNESIKEKVGVVPIENKLREKRLM